MGVVRIFYNPARSVSGRRAEAEIVGKRSIAYAITYFLSIPN